MDTFKDTLYVPKTNDAKNTSANGSDFDRDSESDIEASIEMDGIK